MRASRRVAGIGLRTPVFEGESNQEQDGHLPARPGVEVEDRVVHERHEAEQEHRRGKGGRLGDAGEQPSAEHQPQPGFAAGAAEQRPDRQQEEGQADIAALVPPGLFAGAGGHVGEHDRAGDVGQQRHRVVARLQVRGGAVGVDAQIAVRQEEQERDHRWRREEQTAGEGFCETLQAARSGRSRQSAARRAEREHRAEDPVEEGSFGEAGHDREGDGQRDEPCAAAGPAQAGEAASLDAEKQQRQERDRHDRPVRHPGETALKFGEDGAEGCDRPSDPQRSQQGQRREAGEDLHRDLQQQDTVIEMQQQDEGQEQGRVLHLGRERQSDARVGVPPGNAPVQPVVRRRGGPAPLWSRRHCRRSSRAGRTSRASWPGGRRARSETQRIGSALSQGVRRGNWTAVAGAAMRSETDSGTRLSAGAPWRPGDSIR